MSRPKISKEIQTVKLSETIFVLNALKGLFSMPLVFASRLIQLAKLMMKLMGNALLAILDMSYPRSENVSRQNKSIKILTVRLSEMACVLNVQKELFSMLLEFVSL